MARAKHLAAQQQLHRIEVERVGVEHEQAVAAEEQLRRIPGWAECGEKERVAVILARAFHRDTDVSRYITDGKNPRWLERRINPRDARLYRPALAMAVDYVRREASVDMSAFVWDMVPRTFWRARKLLVEAEDKVALGLIEMVWKASGMLRPAAAEAQRANVFQGPVTIIGFMDQRKVEVAGG